VAFFDQCLALLKLLHATFKFFVSDFDGFVLSTYRTIIPQFYFRLKRNRENKCGRLRFEVSRSFRTPRLAALWFAAPSLPFLRLRGLRRRIPSGAMAPAAPADLGVPPGCDLTTFATAPDGATASFLGFRAPTADTTCRSPHSRRVQPSVCSVLGVSRALDGLLLQQASGPFQAGAAHGVFPSELCSSRAAVRLSASIPSCRS